MKKLYTVDTVGEIPGIGITAPLSTPMKMEFSNVLEMVKRGYVVYEHNPQDLSEKVLVTMKNITNITFQNSRKTAMERKGLNQSLIDEAKPVIVEPIMKKSQPKKDVKETNEKNQDNKQKESEQVKVSKPDDFASTNK